MYNNSNSKFKTHTRINFIILSLHTFANNCGWEYIQMNMKLFTSSSSGNTKNNAIISMKPSSTVKMSSVLKLLSIRWVKGKS